MKLKPIVLAALACVCAAGCRTTKDVLDDYEKNLSLGNYGGSTPELLELADKRDDSQLLWRLMAASPMAAANIILAALSSWTATSTDGSSINKAQAST